MRVILRVNISSAWEIHQEIDKHNIHECYLSSCSAKRVPSQLTEKTLMPFAIRILADQRANNHPEYKYLSSPMLLSVLRDSRRRCAYSQKESEQRRCHWKWKFPLETLSYPRVPAALRSKIRDLILESLLAPLQSTREIRTRQNELSACVFVAKSKN